MHRRSWGLSERSLAGRRSLEGIMAEWYYKLREWRRWIGPVVEAACRVVPGARVYVVGGAARGLLTAVSDIDILVVVPVEPRGRERLELKLRIMIQALDNGLPLDYPVDLHITGPRGAERYPERRLLARCPGGPEGGLPGEPLHST